MTFFITATDHQGEYRTFTLLGEIEVGFALFDYIEATGGTLQKVMIQQGDTVEEVPIDALHAQGWLPALAALTREWQAILDKPAVNKVVWIEPCADIISRRVDRHEVCISQLEQQVMCTEQRLERMFRTLHQEPNRSRTLNLLEGTLQRQQHNLAAERASLVKFLKHVSL